jgi:hypothetical protein
MGRDRLESGGLYSLLPLAAQFWMSRTTTTRSRPVTSGSTFLPTSESDREHIKKPRPVDGPRRGRSSQTVGRRLT